MFPHERSLVQRYQGRPFAFLGINNDQDRDTAKQVVAREGINWRSWWDGGETGSPIANNCGVKRWPSIFVLDGNGIVRYAQISAHQLEQAIETLLRETESSSVQ